MTDPVYEAWRDIRRTAAEQFAAAVDRYMADPPDLSRLRWVRHGYGPRAQAPDPALRERLRVALTGAVHLAAIDWADRNDDVYDEPTILDRLDWEALWTTALADATEADQWARLAEIARDEEDDRALDPNGTPVRHSYSREHPEELLGLIHAWRTGGSVPRRLIVGAEYAADRVGLKPSDVRARLARGHFPEPDDTRRAAYGQTTSCWWADTLDTWWERKPARGPSRTAQPHTS